MLQLSKYLENKALFIDPRFISTVQDVQTHFIDDDQIHIGEESLDDILESNTVLMAFFDRDRLKIVGILCKEIVFRLTVLIAERHLLKKHNLSWKKGFGRSFEVTFDGISYQLISLSLSKTKDYFEFALRKIKRIIPKFAIMSYEKRNETFVGPASWTTFLWTLRRSRFISCRKDFAVLYRKTYPQFFNKTPQIRNGIILTLQSFRNWAIEHGATPMLYAGTLLGINLSGWYRECGIIPYTHDIDFAIFIEEHYDKFPEHIMNSSFMKLSLRFNKPEDLLEYKVFIYPLINRTCATDLLGYLMYVPCNALDVITSEHGKNWSQPLHSSKYIWNESPLNMIEIGTIPPNEKNEYFIEYDR
ncbi:unnamed protein product [Onchocerca ochengi]|uniref:Lipopolysaccharide cholinephosphotransferase n=1 Tax=Onchocerca ochengi TaxID=42157 RepID=A0A182EEW7_ONCOC|nr:unnamed protein product [Onchocerca ochengi]